jgi:hypothetical protein
LWGASAPSGGSSALVELRHLVRGFHTPVLAERGLDGAVRALALNLRVPTSVDSEVTGRLPTPVESAAYFAIAEALTNVTMHSGATFAYVSIRRRATCCRWRWETTERAVPTPPAAPGCAVLNAAWPRSMARWRCPARLAGRPS